DGTTVRILPNTFLQIQKVSPIAWGTIKEIWDNAFNPGEVADFMKLSKQLREEMTTGDVDTDKLGNTLCLLGKSAESFYDKFDAQIEYYTDVGLKVPNWMENTRSTLGALKGTINKAGLIVDVLKACLDTVRLFYFEGYKQKIERYGISEYLATITEIRKRSNPHAYQCKDWPPVTHEDTLTLEKMVVYGQASSGMWGDYTTGNVPALQRPWWVRWDDTKTGNKEENFELHFRNSYDATGNGDVYFDRKAKLDAFLRAEPAGKSLINCVLKPIGKNICAVVEDVAGYFIPGEVKILLKAMDDQKSMADFTLKKGWVKYSAISRAKKRKPNTTWKFGSSTRNSRCILKVWRTKFETEVADDGTVTLYMDESMAGLCNYFEEDEKDKADYWPITWADGAIVIGPGHESEQLPIANRILNPFVVKLAPTSYHAVAQDSVMYTIGFSDPMDKDSVREDGTLSLVDGSSTEVYSGSIQQLIDDGILTEEWQGLTEEDERDMMLLLTHTSSLPEDVYTYSLDLRDCCDVAGRQMESDQQFDLEFSVVAPVGTAGGTVATPEGVEIEIPAGALDGDEQIEIKPASREGELPPSVIMIGGLIFEFSPSGLTFNSPATLAFPLPEDHPDDIHFFWYNSETEEWEDLGGTVIDDTAYVTITHFSKIGVGFSETDWVHFRPVAVADASPKKASIDETITLDGSGSWDHNSGDTLYYRWDYESDGTYDTSWSTSPTDTTSYSVTGVYAATLNVKDNSDDDVALDAVDVVTIYIEVNSQPTAICEADKYEYYEDETVHLDASESYDDDGDALEFRWDFESDGTFDTDWSSDPTAQTSYSEGGTTYTIRLQVRDEEEEYDDDWVIVYVTDDTAIRLDSFTATLTHGGCDIRWVTGSEIDTAGFNLWRSDSGEYMRVNPRMIEAKGSPAAGESYAYIDTGVTPGTACTYKLEEIETNGRSNFYGPATMKAPMKMLQPIIRHGNRREMDVRAKDSDVR
ncbi:MAG: hypothetical protein JW941_09495, partial [Candidatus Coatesbacteria bacterium]|nr:hypothetical protein [Candidatus Coatesbacteria bacterium]